MYGHSYTSKFACVCVCLPPSLANAGMDSSKGGISWDGLIFFLCYIIYITQEVHIINTGGPYY